MQAVNQNHNVCGVLVSVNDENFNDLLSFLMSTEGCEIIEHNEKNQIGLVVEDQITKTAYDIMEEIKDHPTVLSVTLINHFFEKI